MADQWFSWRFWRGQNKVPDLMAHYAEVNNGVVVRVLVFRDDQAHATKMQRLLGGTWEQCSYNTHGGVHATGGTPFRKNYPGIDYIFDGIGFHAPQPYNSWILDQDTYLWNAPIPYPTDGLPYTWNEELMQWDKVNH